MGVRSLFIKCVGNIVVSIIDTLVLCTAYNTAGAREEFTETSAVTSNMVRASSRM